MVGIPGDSLNVGVNDHRRVFGCWCCVREGQRRTRRSVVHEEEMNTGSRVTSSITPAVRRQVREGRRQGHRHPRRHAHRGRVGAARHGRINCVL